TPLTVIHTAAYNLRGKTAANPAQVERYGELIQAESARLKDMVEQVLRYAGASSGRVIREPEPLSIEAVIGETVEIAKPEIELAHGTLESKIAPGLPAVMGDPAALKHAFGNLLSNAAKYGLKDKRWIGVSASAAGTQGAPEVEIRVADRGPGIPADEQAHVFDPFFRGKSAIQDQVHGTGLGLNLVKRIVEAHGGTIRVTSEPTTGTEFIVRLPALPNGGAA
ncbi:MAG TPA: HAMP domain-containing sensor histidine kinase, partial [Candidatus Acidoferrales bacterium]|nr:HAMP domain-containing sensor histidine kinase [Candidatus Acidoferrales bacterium]